MGLFDKLLGSNSSDKKDASTNVPWIALENINQLNDIVELSKETPVVIFKHSTRCGISRMVLNGFEREFDIEDDKIKLYFLDLIQFRKISNEIATRFNVWHESPQLLLIKKGEMIHHSSHSSISSIRLKEFIV
ncbi:bacillithiol system redox-active protein YtxJ [Ascidiimonas sp. W6]|uniref:bacillithiol system redox-active protein YtxJ n=1 Tax=Ascidiimonas meishanensis TaxID=3128903 RepID=UPI0030EC10EA